jgi:enediyne biosynthesis protein E4
LSYSLHKSDLDNEGDDDFVVGNMGLNTLYHVTSGDKLKLYFTDFSGNGAVLPLVAVTEKGKEYPYASRDELLDQIPALKKQYSNYVSYATATLDEMLGTELLTSATQSTADELRTGILWNERGKLIFKPLPVEAQYAPIYAIEALDVNKDGMKDVIIGGNLDRTRVRLGKMDANKGQVFLNKGKQRFRLVSQSKSGISLAGEVRSISTAGPYLLFGINRLPVQLYRLP